VRFPCETCDADATGSWAVSAGRPTTCCDDCNPAAGPASELSVGFWYIRWFPLPKDVSEEFLLAYIAPEVLAETYAK